MGNDLQDNDSITSSMPIVVGGLGGSGTRLIVQILLRSGIYMGNILNRSYDYLPFTILFKSPKWHTNASQNQITDYLNLITENLTNRKQSFIFYNTLAKALLKNETINSKQFFRIIKHFLAKKNTVSFEKHIAWGWKEPNAHIYIKHLAHHFSKIKYIHVIRHGLDMAYSSNIQQLTNWGQLYGIQFPAKHQLIPIAQLDYWICANNTAINTGYQLLGDRCYLLNFDELCQHPVQSIQKLLQFLRIEKSETQIQNLAGLVKLPPSIGRYKSKDNRLFTHHQLEQVRKLGFSTRF